ncbi:hypothetical protein MMSR116_04620 [Methylobacterium mesophilicum SR1.6/6]|uniref:Uncharacterized protein n=1 Tax=Methylobacterium mesophilicum SR1.6/6 TaxID=908290 RepID=A0A6B9FHH5_9HYPH|nr:hypothetical protein MMSR116_04620 [Methylobacterium mesophilicum SR1.6/6]
MATQSRIFDPRVIDLRLIEGGASVVMIVTCAAAASRAETRAGVSSLEFDERNLIERMAQLSMKGRSPERILALHSG